MAADTAGKGNVDAGSVAEAIAYPGYAGTPKRPGFLKRWFGTRRDSTETPGASGLHAGPEPAASGNLEATFGADERRQVPDSSQLPWSAICHLDVDLGGKHGYGTGFLVAPNIVVTAAHVLHPKGFKRGRSVLVMPGRNSTTAPALFQDTTNFYLSPSWRPEADDPGLDFAVIMLEGNAFSSCGTIKLQTLTDADLARLKKEKTLVTVAGYPSDKPRGTLWRSRGPLLEFGETAIYYKNDTKPGQSGGPVFGYTIDDTPVVFAIHVQGDQDSNVARRIHGLAATAIAARLGTTSIA